MKGVLLIDKPAGWTSFDVVNYVRKIVAVHEGKKPKNIKVGHTGTLDPFATGLLVLLVGKEYTRRAGEFSKARKTYQLAMQLGSTSSTGDPEGEITTHDIAQPISEAEFIKVLPMFRGDIMQVPPKYSAIKVNGQRAYKLARAGKEVAIEPRPATIHHLEVVEYDYPVATLVAEVSSGTYIRTLVEDIGTTLGADAYTTALRRTTAGSFTIADAVEVKGLTSERIEHALQIVAS